MRDEISYNHPLVEWEQIEDGIEDTTVWEARLTLCVYLKVVLLPQENVYMWTSGHFYGYSDTLEEAQEQVEAWYHTYMEARRTIQVDLVEAFLRRVTQTQQTKETN